MLGDQTSSQLSLIKAPHSPQAPPFPSDQPLPTISSEQLSIYQPTCPTFSVTNPPYQGLLRQLQTEPHALMWRPNRDGAQSLASSRAQSHTCTGTFPASKNDPLGPPDFPHPTLMQYLSHKHLHMFS